MVLCALNGCEKEVPPGRKFCSKEHYKKDNNKKGTGTHEVIKKLCANILCKNIFKESSDKRKFCSKSCLVAVKKDPSLKRKNQVFEEMTDKQRKILGKFLFEAQKRFEVSGNIGVMKAKNETEHS